MSAIGERAKNQGIALVRTPAGFGFAPRHGDGVMNPDEYRKLPEAEQQRLEKAISVLQEELESAIHDMPKWRREAQRKLRELNRQVTRTAVNGQFEELKAEYRALPAVLRHLASMQEDVLDHAEVFRQPKDGEQPTLFGVPLPLSEMGESFLRRYQVNVLIEHGGTDRAPVVYEDHPTHDNLVGRIEHIAQMGTLVTDFTLIKAGSLHRANGGYLILDALQVLSQPVRMGSAQARAALARDPDRVAGPDAQPHQHGLARARADCARRQGRAGRRAPALLPAVVPTTRTFGELFKVAVDFEEDIGRDAGSRSRSYARRDRHARAPATAAPARPRRRWRA